MKIFLESIVYFADLTALKNSAGVDEPSCWKGSNRNTYRFLHSLPGNMKVGADHNVDGGDHSPSYKSYVRVTYYLVLIYNIYIIDLYSYCDYGNWFDFDIVNIFL